MDSIENHNKRCDELGELKQNWDSYGSAPIDQRAVTQAKKFVHNMYAVPLNGGGIQLETCVHGQDVEITIAPDGRVVHVWVADNSTYATITQSGDPEYTEPNK